MPIVPKSRVLWFFILFVLQFLGTLGLSIYQEAVGYTEDTAIETALAVGERESVFMLIIIATSVIAVEGTAMLYDLYKREVEERTKRRTKEITRMESLQIYEEWDKLSPEEKGRQTYEEFARGKWHKSDEE